MIQTNIIIVFIFLVTTLINNNNGSVHLCDEEYECAKNIELKQEGIITCVSDEDCTVKCTNTHSCRSTTVICPEGKKCNVECSGGNKQGVCQYMVINAILSTELSVNIIPGDLTEIRDPEQQGVFTFQEGTIWCPDNGRGPLKDGAIDVFGDPENVADPDQKACHIVCDGDDVMRNANIYAKEGVNDFDVVATQYSADWCFRSGQMYCTNDYSVECDMTNTAPFECNSITDNNRLCNEYISPTSAPTENPTPSPTGETKSPSPSPSKSPSKSPSFKPTTIIPGRAETTSIPDDTKETETETETTGADKVELRELNTAMAPLDIAIIVGCIIIAILCMVIGFAMLYVKKIKNGAKSHQQLKTNEDDKYSEDSHNPDEDNDDDDNDTDENDGDNDTDENDAINIDIDGRNRTNTKSSLMDGDDNALPDYDDTAK